MNAILLAILASAFWGTGTALMKIGMTRSFPKISLGQFFKQILPVLKILVTNWVWLLGLLLMLGGAGAFGTALAGGDLSVVQPIIGLTGVVAALIGVVFLGERLSRIEWVGVVGIILGVVLVGLGSQSNGPSAGGELSALCADIQKHLPGNSELITFTGLSVLLSGLALLLRRFGMSVEFTLSVSAGILFGLANPFGKFLTQRAMVIPSCEPFSFGSGETWLRILTDYPGWVIVGCNVFAGPMMQTALANGRASIVSPLITIISTVIPILAAITIFGEQLNIWQAIGILIVLVGTACLAGKEQPTPTPSPLQTA